MLAAPARPRARLARSRLLRQPLAPFRSIWEQRELLRQLVLREILQRYRGSYLGLVWSFLTPLLILVTYTLVFSVVFQARWRAGDRPLEPSEFGLILFAGLIPFNVVAECLAKTPALIVAVPNYVKKVVFPLEILPVVVVASAVVHSLMSVGALLIAAALLHGFLPPTLLLLPLAYVPLVLLSLGLGWFLSATGVYVRDISQGVTLLVQVLIFVTPVFYPIAAAPEWLRGYLSANPLTPVVELFRATLLAQEPFSWGAWGAWTLVDAGIAWLGYTWFMHSRGGFADVL